MKHLRPKLTVKIQVRNGFIRFNKNATCWLGVLMDAHLTFKEHRNRCMKKARLAEARLQNLTNIYGVVLKSISPVEVACVNAVALYGSKLKWDPNKVRRQDDLQPVLNRQARYILCAPPTSPRGVLMRESGLTPARVILESRQQQFAARLGNACSNELKELHEDTSSGTPICRVVDAEHQHGQTAEGMCWPDLGNELVVKPIILEDKSIAKGTLQRWAREKEAEVGVGVWMWWTDGSPSDTGRVGAAVVCKHGNEWRTGRSYLGIGRMEVFDDEQWAIGLALGETVKRRDSLEEHSVNTMAVCSDSQASIR